MSGADDIFRILQKKFLFTLDDFTIEKMWITGDVRTGRGKEQWLNTILRKTKNR